MKRSMIILAVMATVFASCSKVETSKTETPSGNTELKFEGEICSIDGVPTKAYVKTAWEDGDEISVWYDENTGDPGMTIQYKEADGKWHILSGSGPNDTGAGSGFVKVVYNGDVKVAAKTNYTFENWVVYFDISEWKFLTQVQVVVSGLNPDDAGKYTLACDKFTPCSGGGYTVQNDTIIPNLGSKNAAVTGISNTDGVAFVFAISDEVTNGDITFTLTTPSLKKEYKLKNSISCDGSKIKAIKIAVSKFENYAPAGALPGIFTVAVDESGNPTKVYFSKGNLYWDSSAFNFETNQYDTQTTWNTKHVSHFFWSKSSSVSYKASYSDNSTKTTDVFFTNAANTTANNNFTVGGVKGQYRNLSDTEWTYLFEHHTTKWATVNGTSGYVIAPDGYEGSISGSYTEETWKTAEKAGLVFLPASGSRSSSYSNPSISNKSNGYYWTSSCSSSNKSYATYGTFSSTKTFSQSSGDRKTGYSVRLVRSAN